MFANATMILDQTRSQTNAGLINQEVLGIPIVDSFIRSYLLGIGDFGTDNYNGQVQVWVFFLMATLIIQLLFLNVLIAIMGDTFDRVSSEQKQSSMSEKAKLIRDFFWVIDYQSVYQQQKYVYVVSQTKAGGDSGDVWEGRIGKLK